MVAIALLMGLSLFAALAYHIASPDHNETPAELGKLYYAWVLALQFLILVVGGFSRISRKLVEERKAGLLDSNRLTPLRPAELVSGYWFGSALRDDFRDESDVDLLATLRLDAHPTLLDWADMQEKLAEVFGRPVDLVSRRAIESSRNRYRKHSILTTATQIYAEG